MFTRPPQGSVIRVALRARGTALLTGLRVLLDAVEDIEVIDASETEEPPACDAQVVVVDCALERLTAELLSGPLAGPGRILLVADPPADLLLYRAIRAGVRGLVVRDGPIAEISRAIRAVHAGRLWLDSAIAERVLAVVGGPVPASLSQAVPLTPREREILEFLADGMSNGEIANRLSVAPRTVKYHVSHVLEKMGARDRAHAVALAYRAGYRAR